MKWQITNRRLPVAHPVSSFSAFSTISSAVDATLLSCQSQKTGCINNILSVYPCDFTEIDLTGIWERCIDKERALTKETNPDLPSSSLAWQPTNVPQNYGLEPDLRYYFGPIWYRRNLPIPVNAPWVDLRFGAVDYLSDVWINDSYLGRHEGYFAPFLFNDISSYKGKNGDAEIIVRVQDPLEDLKGQDIFYISHRKRWIKGTMNYHDSRPGGLPGLAKSEWDFTIGQSMPTGGIIGPVQLVTTGAVRIDGIYVTPLDIKGNVHLSIFFLNRTSASITTTVCLELKYLSEEKTGTYSKIPINAWTMEISLMPGANRIDLESTIPEPKLWYDFSLSEIGAPNLYQIDVVALAEKRISSKASAVFGLRTASVCKKESDESSYEKWSFLLNEREVYIRSANYIPVQHWANLSPDFYERDFRLLQGINLHAVGLHAHVQSPACYSAADRLGISIFQDFPLQWAYASGEKEYPEFIPKATAMVAEMAYLLWNHPSVVYYAVHNEPFHVVAEQFLTLLATLPENAAPDADIHDPRVAPLLKDTSLLRQKETDWGNYHLDIALTETLRKVDPTRHVHLASGAGWDIHEYSGTIGSGTVYDVGTSRAAFVSEYGSWPIDRTSATITPHWASPWPPTGEHLRDLWREGLIGSETGEMAGHFDRYPNLAAFAYATERKASFVAKYQTEFFRIERGNPYCGYRWHFFVNYWCRAGAGLLDMDRIPTMAYHAIGLASRPHLIATTLKNTLFPPGKITFPIYGINDSISDWSATVYWRVEQLTACEVIKTEPRRNAGESLNQIGGTYVLPLPGAADIIQKGIIFLEVPSGKTICWGKMDFDFAQPGPYRLVMAWQDPNGRQENDFTILITPPGWEAEYGIQIIEKPFAKVK